MSWNQERNDLVELGYNNDQIKEIQSQKAQELSELGFDENKQAEYFSKAKPNPDLFKNIVNKNLENHKQTSEPLPDGIFEEFFDIAEKSMFGFNQYTKGFKERGIKSSAPVMAYKALHGEKLLEINELPEDMQDTFYRLGAMSGQIVGDLPLMIPAEMAGAVAGGAIGAAGGFVVGGPLGAGIGLRAGALVGAGAAGAAVPEAVRSGLINFYDQGGEDPRDFLDKLGATVLDTSKMAAVGGVTMGVGGAAYKVAALKGMGTSQAKIASSASELATMTALTKILEPEMPTSQAFWDGAILLGGLKSAGFVASKLKNIYSKTGIKPEQIVEDAKHDMALKQDLLSVGDDIPEVYKDRIDETTKIIDESLNLTKKEEAVANIKNDVELDAIGKVKKTMDFSIVDRSKKNGLDSNDIRTYLIDRFDIIDKAQIAAATPEGKAQIAKDLLDTFTGYTQEAEVFLTKETFNLKGEKTGESLQAIIDFAGKDIQDALAYTNAKMFVDINKRKNIQKFPLPIETYQEVIAKKNPKYEEFAERITSYSRRLLEYAAERNRISKDLVEKLKDEPFYIPVERFVDNVQNKRSAKGSLVKQRKGSERQIINPIQVLVENTNLFLRESRINEAVLSAVDNLKDTGFVEKSKEKITKVKIGRKELEDLGIDPDSISEDQIEVLRRFRTDTKDNEILVYRNGEPEKYTGDKVVIEALKSVNETPFSRNVILRGAQKLSQFKRSAITGAIEFMNNNILKDTQNYIIKNVGVSGKDSIYQVLDAARSVVKQDDNFISWLKSGGMGGEFRFKDITTEMIKRADEIQRDPTIYDKVQNVVRTPMELYDALAKINEYPTRLAAFKEAKSKGATNLEANVRSRRISVNFDQRPLSQSLSTYQSVTNFMKARINGMDQMYRDLKGAKGEEIAKRAFLYVTVPKLVEYAMFKDDERYKEIPLWERFIFWHIPLDRWSIAETNEEIEAAQEAIATGSKMAHLTKDGKYMINDGPVFRIPMAEGYGVLFGTMPWLMTSWANDNEGPAVKDALKQLGAGQMLPFVPDVLGPPVEQMTNFNFFTGQKLVSDAMTGIPRTRYNYYTSETAKQISKYLSPMLDENLKIWDPSVLDKLKIQPEGYFVRDIIGNIGPKGRELSTPVVIDNYIRGWTGGTGQYVIKILDKALQAAGQADVKVKPEMSEKDLPFVGSLFSRYPQLNSNAVENFTKAHSEFKMYKKTLDIMAKNNDPRTIDFLNTFSDKIVSLNGIERGLNDARESIMKINQNPDLSPKEKRQMIDSLLYMRVMMARDGLNQYKELNQELKNGIINEGEEQ